MTQEQFDVRAERAEKEVFVIAITDEGWRVRSAHNPSRHYVVSGNEEGLACSCPDFENHAGDDPDWTCKHVLAVQDYEAKRAGGQETAENQETAEPTVEIKPANGKSRAAQMVVKRSLSPDGRIDSISIEFTSAVDETTAGEIKERALKALRLQTEIVKGFLNGANGRANGKADGTPARTNGGVNARMLDIGISNGRNGERLYLNFSVKGRRARFFGATGQIAYAIGVAGEKLAYRDIVPGLRIDLPCRVLTEQSADGRFLNITRVLPLGYGKVGEV
jgi:predicted nucleic acid-binding Zn finger protein